MKNLNPGEWTPLGKKRKGTEEGHIKGLLTISVMCPSKKFRNKHGKNVRI